MSQVTTVNYTLDIFPHMDLHLSSRRLKSHFTSYCELVNILLCFIKIIRSYDLRCLFSKF